MNDLTKENALNSYSPEFIFSPEFVIKHPELRPSFQEYFTNNYSLVKTLREVTYSTNHVNYLLFFNTDNKDTRILREENGCFHSNQKFVPIDFVQKEIDYIENEKKVMCAKIPKDKLSQAHEHFDNKINSLLNVVKAYTELSENNNEVQKSLKPKV